MTTPPERAIRSILVAGGGITGLSAAIAFARALPAARVGILETPADPAALADRMAGAFATIHQFHQRIGIDEVELVRAGAASHIVGTRFEGWGGEDWYHVHGAYGPPDTPVPFHWFWLSAWAAGKAGPFHLYSVPAAMAAAGKFVHPDPNPQSILHAFDYDLRLEPGRYREILSLHAERRGIARLRGEIGGVERREDGGIAALRLADGRRLEADLFIDAAGPSAPLLSTMEPGFEDWSEWLCDRLLLRESAGGEPSPTDSHAATPWGWRWSSPSPWRRSEGFAFASSISSERDVRAAAGREAELVVLRPGRRPEPWIRNVLAIGDAAVSVDPLHRTNLHLVHSAVRRALALLPGRDCHPLALREYNRLAEFETRRVRDYLALHYLAAGRRHGPFWKAMTRRERPDSLAATLDSWLRRSRFPAFEEETFARESWLAALIGMGVTPREIDWRASALDPAQCAAALERTAAEVAAVPPKLPGYGAYLRRMIRK